MNYYACVFVCLYICTQNYVNKKYWIKVNYFPIIVNYNLLNFKKVRQTLSWVNFFKLSRKISITLRCKPYIPNTDREKIRDKIEYFSSFVNFNLWDFQSYIVVWYIYDTQINELCIDKIIIGWTILSEIQFKKIQF